MDMFHEEVVIKKNPSAQNALYMLSLVLLVLAGAYALFMFNVLIMVISSQGFSSALIVDIVFVLLAAAAAVVLFLYRDRIKMEYEYTFTNGIMDFAQVYNNKKRKNLGSMNIRNVEACGLVSSGAFKRFNTMPGVKMTNWFLNRDAELFYFYFVKDTAKNIIVIEPSSTLVDMIKRTVGSGKYQVN
jgi:hypothetical protein